MLSRTTTTMATNHQWNATRNCVTCFGLNEQSNNRIESNQVESNRIDWIGFVTLSRCIRTLLTSTFHSFAFSPALPFSFPLPLRLFFPPLTYKQNCLFVVYLSLLLLLFCFISVFLPPWFTSLCRMSPFLLSLCSLIFCLIKGELFYLFYQCRCESLSSINRNKAQCSRDLGRSCMYG